MTLEDDIARVAALRGLKPEAVAAAEQRQKAQATTKAELVIAIIFGGHGKPNEEMRAFDRLPLASRRCLVSLKKCPSAMVWTDLLNHHAEADLIAAAERYRS